MPRRYFIGSHAVGLHRGSLARLRTTRSRLMRRQLARSSSPLHNHLLRAPALRRGPPDPLVQDDRFRHTLSTLLFEPLGYHLSDCFAPVGVRPLHLLLKRCWQRYRHSDQLILASRHIDDSGNIRAPIRDAKVPTSQALLAIAFQDAAISRTARCKSRSGP